ncbi:MAG: hypothetical protein CMI60_09040 [Parvibaculum sp.]|nr:hypothetical protein [Parvibaculum sp.]
MSESKELKLLKEKLQYVYDTYGFKECGCCEMPYDNENEGACQECPKCDGCGEHCEQTYDAPNGDDWCKECMESMHDMDDLMRDYNENR